MLSAANQPASQAPLRPSNSDVISGAYVSIEQLLALRHKHVATHEARSSRVLGNRAGQKLSKIKGRGVDFAEVRPYQPGDDIRTIDWRVTARKNLPHTKVFREERERPTLIVCDQTQQMFFGSKVRLKSVAAAELSARIAWQNLHAGDRVGGIVVGNQTQVVHRPFRTSKAVARYLNSVAQFNQALQRNPTAGLASLEEGLLRLRRLTQTNYRIFVLSDFAGDLTMWKNNLHKLARHNQLVVIHIVDPIERELPPANHYTVTDGVDRMQLFTGNKGLREKYRAQFERRCEAITSMCAHEAMSYRQIQTTDTQLDQHSFV